LQTRRVFNTPLTSLRLRARGREAGGVLLLEPGRGEHPERRVPPLIMRPS
jgi:hypothetical protein